VMGGGAGLGSIQKMRMPAADKTSGGIGGKTPGRGKSKKLRRRKKEKRKRCNKGAKTIPQDWWYECRRK